MRASILTLIAAAIGCIGFVAPLRAAPTCDIALEDVAEMQWEELLEQFTLPRCPSLAVVIAERLEDAVRLRSWPEDTEDRMVVQVELLLAFAKLRTALWSQDLTAARELMDQISPLHRRLHMLNEADLDTNEWAEDWIQAEEARLAQIRDVVDKRKKIFTPIALQTPAWEWTINFGFCGTPMVIFFENSQLLNGADALVAIGEPELALQHLLSEQWIEALELGLVPPQLRAVAERAHGTNHYLADIETALANIRIEYSPAGRRAHLPLYGLTLPVPVATKSWNKADPNRFETATDIANYLRPKLLNPAVSPF